MTQDSTSLAAPSSSRIAKKLLPGQPGTKRLLERFGKQLLCVRYRVSPNGRKRFITVELVVSERSRKPAPKRIDNILTAVRIPRSNLGLSRLIWEQGGTWDPANKVWWVATSVVESLGISRQVVQNA